MSNKVSNETTQKAGWKIAVFALGVLLVVGAVVYSLIIRQSDAVGAPSNKGLAPSAVAAAGVNVPASQGIGDLTWVKKLNSVFTDHDFIFVLLPESDGDLTKKVADQVTMAAAKIEAEGVRVDTLTLNPSNPEFSLTTDRLAITQLPAVLAFSISGNGAIIKGEITETKLLQAYLVVSKPPLCAPGSSPGCCP